MRVGFLDAFSKREQEVLLLIAKGMTNKEIADSLQITESTVKSYVHHILVKSGLQNRKQLIVIMHENN